MNEETRTLLALLALALVVFLWMAAVGATIVYACRPGCAGAVVLVLMATCAGWGFVGEARDSLAGWL